MDDTLVVKVDEGANTFPPVVEEKAEKAEKPEGEKEEKAVNAIKKKAPKVKAKKLHGVAAKNAAKAAAKPVKPPTKPKAKAAAKPKVVHTKRPIGPAMQKLALKKVKIVGVCRVQNCREKARSGRSKWCVKHQKSIRKAQLAANNVVWRDRVAEGVAGHHVVYKGKPTVFATENPDAALKLVKSGNSVLDDAKKMKELLAKATKVAKAHAAKQRKAG